MLKNNMITLYNVISEDGFIAALDGSEDFIPDEMWGVFIAMLKNFDALIFSSTTYEAVQRYEPAMLATFEKTPIKKIVVSSRADFTPKLPYIKITSPQGALHHGTNILLSSGPTLNDAFLSVNFINKIILVMVPEKIHAGIPVFNTWPQMQLKTEQALEGSVIWREYSI